MAQRVKEVTQAAGWEKKACRGKTGSGKTDEETCKGPGKEGSMAEPEKAWLGLEGEGGFW